MDKEKLTKQLNEQQDIASWRDLRIHASRDAIIIVDNTLTLGEVGAEFSLDNKEGVALWITDKSIKKPDQNFLNKMEKDLEKRFSFLIVQPYVLVQEIVN